MFPSEATKTQQLADDRLNGQLRQFVEQRRTAVPPVSWRHIARQLFEATGVDVSDQTLSNWFPEYRPRHAEAVNQ